MSSKQDALIDIADIARRHGLGIDEINAYLRAIPQQKTEKQNSILSRAFAYIGGLLIFASLGTFAGMVWDDIGFAGHVVLTLGCGFAAFVMAIVCIGDEKFEKASTPLFLIAAPLQTSGILLILSEFSRGSDPAYGVLFTSFVMFLQQAPVFYAKRRTVLALTSVFFGMSFCSVAFDLLNIPDTLNIFVLSAAVMCIGWSLDNSKHKAIAPLHYFFGSIGILGATYDFLRNSPIEILYLGVCCGIIFLSTVARSRVLLINATLATLCYIGYFTARYFTDTLGWPLALFIFGVLFIAFGSFVVKINNRYIKSRA